MKAKFIALALLALGAAQAEAAPLLSENFDNVGTLAGAGWVATNNSAPVGSTNWFQGNAGVFTSFNGADDAYIAANYLNADALGGNVSNWLLTPQLDLSSALTLTFWTRSAGAFPDSLEVRMSTSGASTDVGTTDSSVGNFSNLLTSIGSVRPYPTDWTLVTINIAAQGAGASGRIAFRYAVVDTTVNGDYIGIDAVNVNSVPEPAPLALLAIGLIALGMRRQGARRTH